MSETRSEAINLDYDWFIKKILELTHLDLRYYKRTQMERRILHIMARNKLGSYHEYLSILIKSKEKLHDFVNWVTINVSEFNRDVDRWQILQNQVFPLLLKKFNRLRIWSAGCSNGSEPYSLAIMLREMGSTAHKILATDVDDNILCNAKEGIYRTSDVRNLTPHIRKEYFTQSNDGREDIFLLNDDVKRDVAFEKHDLFLDPFEQGFHMIVCRNVVIYFTNEAKDVLYKKFASSLVRNGIFFVGSTESLLNCANYGLERLQIAFYEKF